MKTNKLYVFMFIILIILGAFMIGCGLDFDTFAVGFPGLAIALIGTVGVFEVLPDKEYSEST